MLRCPVVSPAVQGDGPLLHGNQATQFPSSTFPGGPIPAQRWDDLLFALCLWYVPGVIFTNWSALWTQQAVRLSVFAPFCFPAEAVSMATVFPVSSL